MLLAEGAVVAGKFRLNRLLGRGGMGSVWHATHLGLDTPCALKFIEGPTGETNDAVLRFEREAKAAAQLRSPNVVQILDHGTCDGTPYIAMELLEGEELGKRLRRLKRLPPYELVAMVRDVARALAKAHAAGIVHRDLKPGNIFLVRDDDREIAKVLDFGIAKTLTDDPALVQTQSGVLLGSPRYMSPEQAQGARNVDARSDLWSLAVIVFECLTGVRPFKGEGLGELLTNIIVQPIPAASALADVPPGFDAWWARAVARDPAARFQTAKELADALAVVLGLSSETAGVLPSALSSGALPSDAMSGSARAPMVSVPAVTGPDGASSAFDTGGGPSVTGGPTSRTLGGSPVASRARRGRWIPIVGASLGVVALTSVVGWPLLVRRHHVDVTSPSATTASPPIGATQVVPVVRATAASDPIAPAPVASASAPSDEPAPSASSSARAVAPATAKPKISRAAATPPTGTASATRAAKPVPTGRRDLSGF